MSRWYRTFGDPDRTRHESSWTAYLRGAERDGKPSPHDTLEEHPGLMVAHQPIDPFEALMQAPPNEPIPLSAAETQRLRELIADAVDRLEPRQRWIWDARVHRRLSFRAIAKELALGKSFVCRQFQRAQAQLRDELGAEPLVADRLHGHAHNTEESNA